MKSLSHRCLRIIRPLPSARATLILTVVAVLLTGCAIAQQSSLPPADVPEPQNCTTSARQTLQTDANEGNARTAICTHVGEERSLPSAPQPQTTGQKLMYATHEAFSMPALAFAAAGAGVNQAQNLYPEFHQGAPGYARNYWHVFADQTVDSYIVNFGLASLLHQDTRYVPMREGGTWSRTGYALSRLIVTHKDSGGTTVNTSELLGSGVAASISSFYYPSRDRTFSIVSQRWTTNLAGDGLVLVLKEFSPELGRAFGRLLPKHQDRRRASAEGTP